jgi:hypothetical protein
MRKGGRAAAFFFADPLRAGHPTNPANKVLWVVGLPRHGMPLTISARRAGSRSPAVRITRPADSEPGEIYPSYVDLPRAGCWRLVLAWGGHRAAIDVQVAPAPAASVPRPAAAAARKVGRKPPVVYVVRHGTTRAVRIGTGSVVAPADRAVPPAGGSCGVPKDI